MDILISFAAKIAELTVEPIGRQVGYLLCYRNNLNELKDQLEELQTTKGRIDHEVEAERRNGRGIEGEVLRWQESVIETLEEAKKLCEDPHDANVGCSNWSFPNLKSRHQRSRKAKKMTNTIAEMKEKGNFDKGVGYVPHLDITNNLLATRGSDKLESRNSVKEDVVLSLKDPKVSKIGVYGISGVGKTTLVKEVVKQVKDDKLFDVVIMVTISQTNLERIQDEIAEQLGLHTLKGMTSSIGRANCLCDRIKKEKTILIILDDLWETIDLEKLGIPSLDTWGKINSEEEGVPLKDDYKGCKLLLTSRSQDILQKNDTEKNFSLEVLKGKESWSLFEAMVGDVVTDSNFRTIATQVAQRCAGLPVLIVTIAKLLKNNNNIYYWKDTLNNLKRVDNRDTHHTLFSALEFNFNRLKDEEKEVFLLCGVHRTSIFIHVLLKYVIGLGIFKCITTIEDARNRLHRIIHDLKASCLLVDDDARAEVIQMHDRFREVAVSIASTYVFTRSNANWQGWPGKDILERCTHIILERCCIQKLPEMLDCPHLTFLHINSTDNRILEIPNTFFVGMGNLDALNLTGLIMSSFPISLSSLTKLKTLCLDECSLKDMTGIGALINLEILSLIHSSMEEFPSEIEQLTKLRMLDLSKSGIGTTLPNIWCSLTKIEELYMGDATINWEVESLTKQKRNASLAKLGYLTGLTTLEIQIREAWLLPKDILFERLERYKVVIGDTWEWSDNKQTSRLLKVKLDSNIHRERGIKTLIKRVENLYLDKISGISNVLFELNGEGFLLLKHLHIQNNGEIQHIINSMERNQTRVLFPELETLILHNLNNLVKICHGPVMDNSFGKLKVVKVKSCNQLVYLFSVSMVEACTQLVEIEVSECSSMKKIVSVESVDDGKTIDDKIEFLPLRSLILQHLPTIDDFCSLGTKQNSLRANISTPFFCAKVIFSNLETLKLNSLNLKKIWDDDQSSSPYLIQNLANLTVEDCSGLKYLFSSSMVRRLLNLKQLEISKCDMMEEIIATEEIDGVELGEVLFPKLEAIIIKDMQNLKTLWHLILASNSLACFKMLKVKSCEKIETIFPKYMNGAFASLETLDVEDCKSVQEIFQLGVNAHDTTQLKYITLLRLPQLKQIWSKGFQSGLRLNNLQVVRVENCGDLEYLFPFSIAKHLPQLEAITIKNAQRMKEIVSKREEPLDNHIQFEFNQLTSMVLWNLQNLQEFCAENHSLSCSLLKKLDVCNCEKLKLFKTQGTSSQGRLSDDNLHASMQQPLFTLEEVIDNLENLNLNNEDASMIFQSQVPRDQFRKLKFLRLLKLEDAQVTSPYWFLQNISSLEFLVIQDNSFKVIFPDGRPRNENGEIEIKTQLKKLLLHSLHELQHICKEGCQLDPVLEVLEWLMVKECSNLKKHLVPSSVTLNHLTYLEVQNCSGLIYLITSSTARSLVKLIALKIRKCDLVDRIVAEEGGESNNEIEFNSLQVLELESLPKLNSFGSSNCSLKLPLLEKLVIRQCPRMKTFSASSTSAPLLRDILTDEQDAKWFCDGDLNSTVEKIFQHMVAFRCMKRLELFHYPELGGDVWYSHVKHGMFGNLKNLVVHKCDILSKVLLPLNLVKELSNLEELQVSECDSLEALIELPNMNEGRIIEKVIIHLKKLNLSCLPEFKHIWNKNSQEIVSLENLGEIASDNSQGLHTSQIQGSGETTEEGDIGQVLFPNLEAIMIKDMPKLKTIWHPFFTSNSFSSLKTMQVSKCEKLDNIFPSYMERAFTSLETLTVSDCNSVQVIFEFSPKMGSAQDTTRLQKLTLLRLSKLKQIWSRDPQENLAFHKLLHVCVENCNNLEYLFPLSIAKHVIDLEDITIKHAKSMKQIVSEKEGILDSPIKFEFNRLTSLALWNVKEMEGFFAGYHSLLCPSLRALDIRNCAKVKLFKIDSWSSQGRVSMQQPLFTLEEVICKLEQLALNSEDADIILQGQLSSEHFIKLKVLFLTRFKGDHANFPYWFLQKLTSLEALVVEWSSFKEIFDKVIPLDEKGKFDIRSRIKKLTLNQLHELQHICKEGFQMDPILEVLENLRVMHCSNMKHLVPSSVTFCQLTYLEVQNCIELIDLVTSSTARSLIKLTTLKIRGCNSLTQVVAKEREEAEDEITLRSLKNLELQCLPEIKCFSSTKCFLNFPLLEHVVVEQCPRMNIFTTSGASTPKLRRILSKEEDEKLHWDGDLNGTINKMFVDMVAFSSFNHLEFSEYPELKELWYSPVGQKIFCNLKHLVVRKCTFLSNVILSSNLLQLLYTLEELEVAECDSLETVFDVKALDDKAMESKEISRLKKLTLSGLPNLKHIWNTEAGEIISFENLQDVKVDKCQCLKSLFSVSLCQDLRQLDKLHIESCGVEEIVSIEEGLEELKFDFPRLTILILINLMQLTNFYPKGYTLECPSLKTLNVRGCEELQIFAFDHLNSQPLRECDIELQIEQALFYIEKVSQNLEELPLNEKDTMRILNGNYEKNFFQSTKMLRLQYFKETPMKFLNDLIQMFPTITALQARCSSFGTLFPPEEISHCSIESPIQVKTLWLFQLEQLEHIWSDEDSASHPLVQNLEDLHIGECSRIIRLAPPSASFEKLTSLKVKDCNGLMYFMTSCTAKSLVHLTSLTVSNCGMLEEIVMTNEGESEEEITFERLKYMELNCLSGFKSFCSGKHTFIFPSWVTLQVIGCHKMQYFSSEAIIAPFLKVVKVENGKDRWKEDLNYTIKQLFAEKAIGEGLEGDYKESSSINIQSNQTYQKSARTSRALTSEEHGAESKANEIVDLGKQEMHKLPIPHIAIDTQKICEIAETSKDQASQSTLNLTKVDADIETGEVNATIQTSFAEAVESTLTLTSAKETNIRNQEMYRTLEKALVPVAQNVLSSSVVDNIALQNQEMDEMSVERPLVQSTKIALTTTKVYDADTGTIEMHKTIQRPLVQNSKDMSIPASVHEIAVGTHVTHESIDEPFVQATQNTWDITIVQEKGESHNLDIHLSKNLFHQTTTSMAAGYRETIVTQETCESKRRFSVHDAQNALSSIHDTALSQASKALSSSTTPVANVSLATETQEIQETMDKSLIQTDQDAEKHAITQNKEAPRDLYIETQKIYNTIKKPSILTAQNVPNSAMIPKAAIDPSPSQAREPIISPIQKSNIYRNYKGMIDIPEQNMPHLETGVKRHPQVLDWLNTKRQRVFASSFFSLFSEVTRILRTTRRVDLTKDDRNYITECCAALQGVGFDDSWISYVHDCIEECGDGEDLKRKVEEAEGQASNLKAQLESIKKELAFVEESLVLLCDKASRLHDFIES